ncbi:MAG: hypothetical protein Q4G55_09625 [bacterium]|nr:hypothetical protein [bacterium]
MKKLTFALACASTFALFAEIGAPTAGFESPYEAGNKVVGEGSLTENGATFWLYDGASGSEDGSTVKAYGGDNLAAPTTGDDPGTQYLELSTEGGTLWRSLAAGNTAATDIADKLGDAQGIPDGGLYIDTMVQFTPTEDGGAPDTTGDDKLAIWLNVDSSSGEAPMTNLCVKARQVSGAECDGTVDPHGTIYKITNVVPQPGTWYRLTVKAVSDLTSYGGFGGFQIFLDNTVLVADKMTVDGDAYWTLSGDVGVCSEEKLALITEKKVFASLVELTGLQAVGFKGSGALDNLAITAQDPLPAPGEMIDFTITAGANTTVAWSTDGKTWTDYVAGAEAPAGRLYVRLTNADGATKILTKTLGSVSNSFDVSAETFGWAEYLGEAIDGAYVIDDVAELVMFQKGVATLGSAGVTFKLGADIALKETFAGIGLANAKDEINNAVYKEKAFQGSFDGDGHTISGLILQAGGDYIGLFNSCYNAEIKNLKVSLGNETGWSDADTANSVGAVIVGVAADTTIENCQTVVDGTYNTFRATKTAAGIVAYAANGTKLINCVNNLNIVSVDNEKAGGLIACAQSSGSFNGDGVIVDGCTNNGNVSSEKAKTSRASGLVSYTDNKVTFKGHNVFVGTVAAPDGVQSIINLNKGSMVVADGATFTVPAAYRTVNQKAVDGVFYATVVDGVATLVKNEAAVAGANLKVMANGAPEVVLANIGDAITLDTTLATVTVTTTAENAEVKQEGNIYKVVAKSAAEDWPEDPSTMAEKTAGEAYNITGVLADAEADKLAIWAKANSVAFAGAAEAIKVEAYLLNVANTDAAIAEGKANFKIPAITVDANGTVTVTDPEGSYNGKITIKGSVTVNGTYDLEKTDTTARFFKAFLSVK